eukprot:TRINITY_DN1082_c0_g1_i2.p1 TRINITY_DN1082_c0_g1~~TRINITY_DN1082_c0_g1_i2.p1  ORF type:complete len:276 (+),score=49.68 TRINITY_DN1082_c0_g1_i2:601-1428(+)
MMSRYMYLTGLMLGTQNTVATMRNFFLQTISKKDDTTKNEYKKLIKNSLTSYEIALKTINKLYIFRNEILPSLATLRGKYIDFQESTLELIKGIVETNANSVFFELLRILDEQEAMVAIAKGSYDRFVHIQSILKTSGTSFRRDLQGYVDFMVHFTKMQGMFAILILCMKELRVENYKRKKYAELVNDQFFIAQDIFPAYDFLRSKKDCVNPELFKFACTFVEQEIIPHIGNVIAIFEPLVKKENRYPGEKPFLEWQTSSDYFEELNKAKALEPK